MQRPRKETYSCVSRDAAQLRTHTGDTVVMMMHRGLFNLIVFAATARSGAVVLNTFVVSQAGPTSVERQHLSHGSHSVCCGNSLDCGDDQCSARCAPTRARRGSSGPGCHNLCDACGQDNAPPNTKHEAPSENERRREKEPILRGKSPRVREVRSMPSAFDHTRSCVESQAKRTACSSNSLDTVLVVLNSCSDRLHKVQ